MENEMTQTDWKTLFKDHNVNDNWETFKNILLNCQEKYVPKVASSGCQKPRQAWLTPDTKTLIKEKKTAYRRYRKNKCENSLNEHKRLRNKAKRPARIKHSTNLNLLKNGNAIPRSSGTIFTQKPVSYTHLTLPTIA